MTVNVNESWNDELAPCIDGLSGTGGDARLHGSDAPPGNRDVTDPIELSRGINDAPSANHEVIFVLRKQQASCGNRNKLTPVHDANATRMHFSRPIALRRIHEQSCSSD